MRSIATQGRILLAFLVLSSVCGCGDSPDLPADDRPEKKRSMIDEASPRKDRAGKRKKKVKRKKLSKKERKALREERRRKYAKRLAERMRAVDESLPAAERKIAIGLRDGLENGDLAAVAKFSLQARNSSNAEIRAQAVDALNWFGKRALTHLTCYLNDPDEDVASSARTAWEAGLSEIEDDGIKRGYLETVMTMVSDESMLDSLAMHFNGMDDQSSAVESLARIVEGGGDAGSAAAKEAYEFITGEPWSGKAAALKWAAEHRPEPEE